MIVRLINTGGVLHRHEYSRQWLEVGAAAALCPGVTMFLQEHIHDGERELELTLSDRADRFSLPLRPASWIDARPFACAIMMARAAEIDAAGRTLRALIEIVPVGPVRGTIRKR